MLQNVLLRQATNAAAAYSRLHRVVGLLQQPLRLDLDAQHRHLHCSETACASDDGDASRSDDGGPEPAGPSLPAGATAAQMREWADRMLQQSKAADALPGSGADPAAAEDADGGHRAASSEEAAVGAPTAQAEDDAEPDQAADALPSSLPDVSAWRRFVDDRLGTGARQAGAEASTLAPVRAALPLPGSLSRRLAREQQQQQERAAGPRGPSSAEDILSIKDPRKELERLLPVHARRHEPADSGIIRRQEDYDAPEQLPFKASEGLPEPPPPKRLTVIEPPMDVHANPATGYAQLGRPQQFQEEREADALAAQGAVRGQLRGVDETRRLHPSRTFFPGQLYEPEDLVKSEVVEWRRTLLNQFEQPKATNSMVRAQADFRNQAFLNKFITELGKLPPKRTTRLQQKTHRHMCRAIKLARHMALLPIDSQLPRDYLERVGAVPRQARDRVERNPAVPARGERRQARFEAGADGLPAGLRHREDGVPVGRFGDGTRRTARSWMGRPVPGAAPAPPQMPDVAPP